MTARPAFRLPTPPAPRVAHAVRLLRRAAFVIGAAVLGYGAFAIAFPRRCPRRSAPSLPTGRARTRIRSCCSGPRATAVGGRAARPRAVRSVAVRVGQSCASCHSPDHAYGPPNALDVQPGGLAMTQQGYRPPPSLMYLYRQPNFSIGPDAGETTPRRASRSRPRRRPASSRRRRWPARRPRRNSCRRAGCSGMAAPIRCSNRRSARC